ncbi:MAG: hypothetical protein ACO1N0_13465 [Fluviicola sp.]
MANHAADNLNYFLLLEADHQWYLGAIRHWNNLKVGFDEQGIWIKEFDYAQIQSVEVKTIPYKKVFYEKNGRLFPLNSLLPEGTVPALIWTPIDRAIPVTLPALNHNYFGVNEPLTMRLVAAESEQESVAMIVDLDVLGNYLEQVPEVRLKNLSWCILDDYTACVLGTPLLSVQGEVFWQSDVFLIPSGFELELHALKEALKQLLEVSDSDRILWLKSGKILKVAHTDLKPLSRASFRMNIKSIT